MKKTGLLLKETREKQGVSLNAVSAATKISVKVLEAVEDGDLSQLPPKTFVRGFVQTYAMYLKLDPKTVLDLFQEEVGTTRYNPVYDQPKDGVSPLKSEEVPKEKVREKTREAAALSDKPGSGVTKWLLAGLALLLFIAIYFVSQTVQKYKRESEVSQFPPEVTEEALPTASPTAEATPVTVPEATPSESAAPSPLATPPGSPSASMPPSPSPMGSPSPLPSPSPSPSTEPSPTPTASPLAASTIQNVTIEALDTVKVDFVIDGGEQQTITLEPEQKRKFSAKKSFTAQVSDGGAISVIHNGRDRGVPGNLGQPVQLSYPPKE